MSLTIGKAKWHKNSRHGLSFYRKKMTDKTNSIKDIIKTTRTDYLQKVYSDLLMYSPKAVRILDVGSGPYCLINSKHRSKKLTIVAVDALADKYDVVLKKLGIKTRIKTRQMFAEELTGHFAQNHFDIVCTTNALDHTLDPLKVVEQMVAVTKKGGHIVITTRIKEANRSKGGMHNWNLFMRRGQLWLQRKGERRIYSITARIKAVAEQVDIINSEPFKKPALVTVVFQKMSI